MPTQLIITEKPKVAATMAAALSSNPVKKGLDGVAYYELTRGKNKILVAPAVGHVYSLAQRVKQSGYPTFDIEWVPAYESNKESGHTRKYLAVLRKLAKEADEIYSACDYDIEGSLIAGNIIRHLAKNKPAKRMLYASLVPSELEEAYEKAGPLDDSSIDAGEARHMLDWFWGINVSRALMSALKRAGRFKVLSIGRVQGPALALLSKREREIAAFKPEPYWQVFANSTGVLFTHEQVRFAQEADAAKILDECKNERKGTISKLDKKQFEQPPGVPFDLTTLQVEAYRCFGYSPTRTLELAQHLYEGALISYPRTSSQKLPAKLNLPKIISQLQQNPLYAALAKQLIDQKRFVPKEGGKTDSAHVSIYPTGMRSQKLPEEQFKLYDLIVRRFLSCFAPNATRESVKVTLQIASQPFTANGVRTLAAGWTQFYADYTPLEETVLPDFVQGAVVPIEKVWQERKETKPPHRFTPTSVIRELEKHRIGTKSTRAAVVETLYARNYLTDRKSIKVTDLGLSVEEALTKNVPEILSEQLTRDFEAEMELIQASKIPEKKVVDRGRQELEKILAHFREKEEPIGAALSKGVADSAFKQAVLGPCQVCLKEGRSGTIVIKKSRFGFFAACDAYPNCKTTFPLPKMALIEAANQLCKFCNNPVVKVISKGRRPFEMCLLPGCESKASWGQKGNFQKKDAGAPGSAPAASSANASAGVQPAQENDDAPIGSSVSPLARPAGAQRSAPVPSSPVKPVASKSASKPVRKTTRKPKSKN